MTEAPRASRLLTLPHRRALRHLPPLPRAVAEDTVNQLALAARHACEFGILAWGRGWWGEPGWDGTVGGNRDERFSWWAGGRTVWAG
jgi:hypothetical protein